MRQRTPTPSLEGEPNVNEPSKIQGSSNSGGSGLSRSQCLDPVLCRACNHRAHPKEDGSICAVPAIFPAVQIGEHAYWDGLFSDNPPVAELIRARSVGIENIPEEIWLIKINPTACHQVPVLPADILHRRNELEGNISLFHQLGQLEALNDMLLAGAFNPEFLASLDIQAPILIPKSFTTEADKPYHIPCIEMSAELQETLDYESKLDRDPRNIDRLMAEGERCAKRFLAERAARVKTTQIKEKKGRRHP